MSFSITVLMENTAAWEGLAAEHGLSLLVEGPDCRVLYDTGASPRFWNNARSMGVSLSPLDALVLSHGHYDHTGGTAALLGEADLAGPGVFHGPLRPKKLRAGRDRRGGVPAAAGDLKNPAGGGGGGPAGAGERGLGGVRLPLPGGAGAPQSQTSPAQRRGAGGGPLPR